jgi:hypothetical protein
MKSYRNSILHYFQAEYYSTFRAKYVAITHRENITASLLVMGMYWFHFLLVCMHSCLYYKFVRIYETLI